MIALVGAVAEVSGETITDARLGFSLALPSGFMAKTGPAIPPGFVYAFVHEASSEGRPVMLFIKEMGGYFRQGAPDCREFSSWLSGNLVRGEVAGLRR